MEPTETLSAAEKGGSPPPSPASAGVPPPPDSNAAPPADDEETLDLTGGGPPPEPELADIEARRDDVRLLVTAGLLAILAFIIVWSCVEAASWPDHWQQTKEMLQIILPALTGLIGSVLGFYFGAGGKSGGTRTG